MIWLYLIGGFILLGVLDTLIGNRLFPSQTGVVTLPNTNRYWCKVYKYHRYFFIPVRLWLDDTRHPIRVLVSFTPSFDKGNDYRYDEAILWAKIYANQASESIQNIEVVWTSRRAQKEKSPTEQELTIQLGQALIDGRKEDEIKLMEKMRELNYLPTRSN